MHSSGADLAHKPGEGSHLGSEMILSVMEPHFLKIGSPKSRSFPYVCCPSFSTPSLRKNQQLKNGSRNGVPGGR
jgi:hypothetical protein